MSRALASLPIFAALVLASAPALAQDTTSDPTLLPRPSSRRSGVVLGTSLGVGLGGSSGYPNAASFIGDPRAYGASGVMFGGGGNLFLMGAIADFLNFGVWFGQSTFEDAEWRASSTGGGFRVEAFPLFSVHPVLRDLGVFGQFGFGSAALDPKTAANGSKDGAQSYIGTGVFYEFSLFKMLGGHLSLGPSLEYGGVLTRSLDHHGMLLGGRLAFYGGQ